MTVDGDVYIIGINNYTEALGTTVKYEGECFKT